LGKINPFVNDINIRKKILKNKDHFNVFDFYCVLKVEQFIDFFFLFNGWEFEL